MEGSSPERHGGIRYLDPFSEPGTPTQPYAARIDVTVGAPVIGLFSNLFVDASVFLDDIAEAMPPLVPGASFRRFDKGHVRNASFPAPDDLISRISAECDAVILAYGHCGSCTAGLVRDTVAIARKGVPLASLVTWKFIEEAQFIARAAGVPDVPFVFLPHPIAGELETYQRAVARHAVPHILEALRSGGTVRIDGDTIPAAPEEMAA